MPSRTIVMNRFQAVPPMNGAMVGGRSQAAHHHRHVLGFEVSADRALPPGEHSRVSSIRTRSAASAITVPQPRITSDSAWSEAWSSAALQREALERGARIPGERPRAYSARCRNGVRQRFDQVALVGEVAVDGADADLLRGRSRPSARRGAFLPITLRAAWITASRLQDGVGLAGPGGGGEWRFHRRLSFSLSLVRPIDEPGTQTESKFRIVTKRNRSSSSIIRTVKHRTPEQEDEMTDRQEYMDRRWIALALLHRAVRRGPRCIDRERRPADDRRVADLSQENLSWVVNASTSPSRLPARRPSRGPARPPPGVHRRPHPLRRGFAGRRFAESRPR